VLGTNPIAFACPTGTGMLSADFATTSITRGELLSRASRGEPLPSGAAVDGDGRPTNDATAALSGGLLSFDGSMKGFLVSVLLSLLAGPAIGARMNHLVTGTRRTDSGPTKGDLFLAVDLPGGPAEGEEAGFAAQVQSFFDVIGDETEVRVPGSASLDRRQAALRDGIVLPDEVRPLLERYL
jgi:LDH2 family malate/lactate/ureidoglycolate dehydrogenase